MSTFDLENPNPAPGDSLRDQAANLLTARFGRPVREARASGKKVDLYFTRRDYGKQVRFYVEAKDYSRNLSRDEVVHIWADYSGIIEANRPATLLLVTRGGLSPDAQAFVLDERAEMRHQTVWELENESLGLTEYTRWLVDIFAERGLASYYVEGRGRLVSYDGEARSPAAAPVEMFPELMDWIASEDPRPIAVLGGYGAGKSSLAKRLISAQAELALADPMARRPVLIPLGNLARYSNLEGLLGGMFSHDFPVEQGFNTRTFLALNARGRLLIALDGFDEMKHAMSWADFRAQIADLNRLTQGRAKILLLGRPSAFTSADEHFHVLRGLRRWEEGWIRLPDWPEFIEYDLEEFTAEERARFFRGYLSYRVSQVAGTILSDDWIDSRVAEVERLADAEPALFAKPVHAKILVDLASDPSVDLSRFVDGLTRWGLYQIFFTSLVEREVDKEVRRPISEEHRLAFLREVAFWLWTERGGATSFSASDLPDSIFSELSSGGAADIESLKREYLAGSFLEKKAGDVYYFGHRSFAEFLVADRMVASPPSPRDQPIYSALIRGGVLEFLLDAPDRAIFARWTDSLSNPMGPIHLEYLAFLAEMLGGKVALRAALPSTSIWIPILDLFEDNIVLDEVPVARLISAMNTEHNVLFFLVLSLLQRRLTFDNTSTAAAAILVAGALLDRLFSRANYDESSRKAAVELSADETRSLAQAVIASVQEEMLHRVVNFRGKRLLEEKEQRLREAGTDIVFHPPATAVGLAFELALPWSSVLQALGPESQVMARSYFARSTTLRDVFTRQVGGSSRRGTPRWPKA